MKLSIIVPVYNEEKTILEILKKIDAVDFNGVEKEIIIVDDGSIDGTRAILKNLTGAHKIFYHERNLGKGLAIRTGLKHVIGDYIIIQDADLEYDPRDYQKLLGCAKNSKGGVVYGTRYPGSEDKYSHVFFYLGGRFLTWLTNFLYGAGITDEATCYKLFKKEIICDIDLKCQGFDFCPEITAKILKRGIKIYEVPINYHPRDKKQGKKIKLKDGLYAIWILIKYKFVN
jgi:glycosyltransferase involved in cell wall biosynthesis